MAGGSLSTSRSTPSRSERSNNPSALSASFRKDTISAMMLLPALEFPHSCSATRHRQFRAGSALPATA
ncbi:hypothetical protein RHECNPAF_890047 [Rhizobium etli CNPAF512]|nr:hypothetical protein RHECNPAF_890047 [Rhizobium etli CNPAF512]